MICHSALMRICYRNLQTRLIFVVMTSNLNQDIRVCDRRVQSISEQQLIYSSELSECTLLRMTEKEFITLLGFSIKTIHPFRRRIFEKFSLHIHTTTVIRITGAFVKKYLEKNIKILVFTSYLRYVSSGISYTHQNKVKIH
jgi:hypothetical protein